MQAYGYAWTMPGLPIPSSTVSSMTACRAAGSPPGSSISAVTLIVGVPLALAFGLLTLGFGFSVFPFPVASVGFVYRTITIAGGSATWGMRLMGIELRRADGSRFDLMTAILHTAIYTVAFGVLVLQLVSCLAMAGSRYGQGLPDLILRTTAINRPED